jgi:hypothetical protein
MQKCLIFILMFFSLAVQARANWNPYVMDHERFVHLSEQDKRAVIISTMELMVELESKYKKEVKTSGYNQENYDKFVEAISKLSNFVLNSAIADDTGDKGLEALARKFSALLDSLKDEGCVYGGYVSKMGKTSSGIRYCRHPSTMKDSDPIKKAYLDNGGTCTSPSKISCNPVIFGSKPADNTPFCVDTGYLKSGKAHNVSYDCMREALKEDDHKKSGVTVLQAAMSEFKDEKDNPFNAVHSFIFKTCACDGAASINQKYADYIKPHRTCFGMMNTLRVVKSNECEVINTVDHTKFPNQWSEYFGKAENFKKLDHNADKPFDETYKSIIDHDAVKAICEATPVKPVPEKKDEPVDVPGCTITFANVDGEPTKSKATVSFQNTDEKQTEILWDGKPASDLKKPAENVVVRTKEMTQVKVSFKIKGEPPVKGSEPLSCSEKVPPLAAEDPSKENYDIKAKTDTVKPKDMNATVNATIQKKGEKEDIKLPLAGHQISWYREGAKAAKVKDEPGTAMKDSDAIPGDKDKKDPKDKNDDKETEVAPEIGTGPSTSQPREKVAYKVCAQLIEDISGKPVAGPACDTIPALKDEAPKPSYNPGQNAPPPQFIMPVNNTRQMGIL